MSGSSNSSFIPKRNPIKQKRNQPSRRVYVFTIASYVLLFASLIAAGGVFFYQQYIDAQLQNEIKSLNNEISSFSEADMQRVLEFDRRIAQAEARVDNNVSVASVFEAIEDATIDTVQMQSLNLDRVDDENFNLSARIITDTFDSTIFQRGVFQRNQVIDSVVVSNVSTGASRAAVATQEGVTTQERPVLTFDAELGIPLSAVPYIVNASEVVPFTITNPADVFESVATTSATGTPAEVNNEAL